MHKIVTIDLWYGSSSMFHYALHNSPLNRSVINRLPARVVPKCFTCTSQSRYLDGHMSNAAAPFMCSRYYRVMLAVH